MTIIDLSHTMKAGLRTYKGLPAIQVCDYLSRAESRKHYEKGTEFQIDQLELIGNSGTYIDSPFHRFSDGKDLSEIILSATVDIPGLIIRAPATSDWMPIDESFFKGKDINGKAVLFDTGWSKHFGSDAYFENHPFLTESAALALRDGNVALVGIDSHNIDDIRTPSRPTHTVLLGNDIPIVEHLCNLNSIPDQGFLFTSAPLKFKGVGTFPTRAYAKLG